MEVGVAQVACRLGDVAYNCSQISAYAKHAKKEGCSVLILPEMVDTGYEMATIQEKASSWHDAPFKTAQRVAMESQIYLILGISERAGDKIYNTAAVFDPKGVLKGKYRKIHLAGYPPLLEDHCIEPGNALETVSIHGMTFGLTICYDLRFPELSRSLVLGGAEVLVLIAAWPFPRITHFKTLIRARAVENQTYMVVANRVGTDGSVTFCGSSCLVDPYGVTLASAAEDTEAFIKAEVTSEAVQSVRSRMPVFKHRRQDLY